MARKNKSGKKNSTSGELILNTESVSKLIIQVTPKNKYQEEALDTIENNQITFLHGIPGSGKSFLAVAYGLQEFFKGNYKRIIFTRPYVEAGEKLGFLPGGFDMKFAPYAAPLFDIVGDFLSQVEIKQLVEEKKIIIYPLAYMRGVTLKDSFVVVDESQNTTVAQMRLILTRTGENTKMVVTGDTEQSDLNMGKNGLSDAINRLAGVEGLGFYELPYESCVRPKIVADIDRKYRTKS